MNQTMKNALKYVMNTNGAATRSHFFEDHEPIGETLWDDLLNAGGVREDRAGRIWLTDLGVAELSK